ncbi:MAG: FHA domain-containing protein [Planctomycetes bacterium]|nr:FHA domain-containing protein [Planctomycetota bacterium]
MTRGPAEGQIVPLDASVAVTIGRSGGNLLPLRDEKVSSHHARVEASHGGIVITDLGSKNGTFVGGQALAGSLALPLNAEVVLGGSAFIVRPAGATGDVKLPSVGKSDDGGLRVTAQSISPSSLRRSAGEPARDLVLQPAMHPSQRNLTKAQRNLAVLAEVGDLLASERDADRFLTRLMDLIFEVLPADRGCLIMLEDDDRPVPRVTRISERAGSEEIHVSRTILSKVLGGASILTADAGSDSRLSQGASIIAQNVRSAMCVPIRGRRKSIGTIYVDTVLTIGVFGKDDLEMLSTVGVLTGTALENIQLFRENLQHERMAAIGNVVAGLGHDIRNMLTALRGGMYLIDEFLKDSNDENLGTAWGVVRHGHESIVNLVQDMVSYSKPRDPDWRMSDINQCVSNAVAFARERATQKNAHVTELTDPTIPPFWFDGAAIERAVLNLMTNAIDAVAADTGQVSVLTRPDDEKGTVLITVQDNGEGIAPDHREKVFDLLFSTKGSRGTGFGLAITKKLVQEHSGRVWFHSEVGKGTTFFLELPLRVQRPAAVLV